MAEEITISTEELTKLVETFKNMGDPIALNTAELIKLAKAAKVQNKLGEEMVVHVVNANLKMKQFGQNADKLSKSIRDTTEAYKRGELNQKELEKSVADLRHEIEHTSDKARRASLMIEKASLEEANLREKAGKEFSDGLGRITTQVGASMMKNIMTAATGMLSGQDAMTVGTQMMKGNIDNLNTGVQAGAKGLESLGAATAGAGGKVGLFGIAVSGAGAALGMFANAATELTKQGLTFMLTQSQQMISGFQQMSQVGAIYAGSLTQMTATALDAGMTIDQFSKSINENKESLGKLGIGATEATKRLSKAMGFGGEEVRRGMFALGMTMDEQATAYADTMARMAGPMGKLIASDQEISEATIEYAKNLKLVSDLTGKSAKQQQSDEEKRSSSFSMQIALSKMEKGAREKLVATMGSMDDADAKAMQQRIASGGNAVADSVTAQLENMSPALKALHEQQYALGQQGKLDAETNMRLKAAAAEQINKDMAKYEGMANAAELNGKNVGEISAAAAALMKDNAKLSGVDVEKKITDLKAAKDKSQQKDDKGKYTDTGAAALMEANQDMATSMQKLANDNLPKFSEALLDTIKNMKEGIAKAVASIGVEKGVMAGALGQLSGLIGIVGGIASTVLPLIMMKGMMKGTGPVVGALGGMTPGSMSGWKAGATAGGPAGPGSVLGGAQGAGGMGKVGSGMASLGEGAAKLGAGLGKGGGALIEGILTGIAGGLKAFAAPQVVIGAAAFGAAIALIGAGIAGAAWLLGKALPTLAEGLGKFNNINGKNLIDVGLGAAALGAGLAVFAMGGAAAGVGTIIGNLTDGLINFFGGKTPLDKLVEFSKLDIDAARTKLNAEAFVAFGNAMAAYTMAEPGIFSAIGSSIASFFTANPPLAKLLEFSKMEFDAKKVKENGDAVAAFGLAMNVLKDVHTQPGVFATIGDSIGRFFGAKMPYDKLEEFGKLNLDVKKIKDNAEAFKAFAEAMGQWHGVGGARVIGGSGPYSGGPAGAPGGPQGGAGSGQAPAPTSSRPPVKVEPTEPPGKPTIPGAIATPSGPVAKTETQAMLLKELAAQGITDPKAQANVMAQVQAESAFKPQSENMNYSGKRLYEMFGKGKNAKVSSLEDAEALAKAGPGAIGNRVYGGRMGNAKDEGFKYRGRGMIQLTGKDNYAKYGKMVGADLVANPELANDPAIAAKISAAYFADKQKHGTNLSDINSIGKAVGYRGGDAETAKRAALAQGFETKLGDIAATKISDSSKVAADLTKTFAEKTQVEKDAMQMGRGRKGADAGPTTVEQANAAEMDSLTKRYGRTISSAEANAAELGGTGNQPSGPSAVNAQLANYHQSMLDNVSRSVRGMENYRAPQYNNQNEFFNTVAANRGIMPTQLTGEMGADGKRGRDPLTMGFSNLQQIMSKVADFQEQSVGHQEMLVGIADDHKSVAEKSLRAME